MKRIMALCAAAIFVAFVSSGCAVNFYKGKPEQEKQIKKLTSEVNELEEARKMLEDRLANEIRDKQILLELASRGLIITMADEILFDSGKAQLKNDSHSVLDRVSSVIKEKLPDRNIGVEGHTDNMPIRRSGWKSNWELSTARATSVLHYLIDVCGIEPQRLSAIGYGEYRPVASNDTKEGMSRNRRVEIVILPKEITKSSYENDQAKISDAAKAEEEAKAAEQEASIK
ncbi:MAG: OmpA family protein [Candidatus Omnitrophota bacterium]